jgi:curved DNA binding protein
MEDPFDQLENESNIDKYKDAGKITMAALDKIIKKIKPNTKIQEICDFADNFIITELDNHHKDIKHKGIAFPTSISKNNIIGHYTPTENDLINKNDLIKIELGTHIDGFPAIIAYTMPVTDNIIAKTDKKNNILKATIFASRDIFQIMKPGNTSTNIIKILNKYADEYNCSIPQSPTNNENYIIPGIMSFQVSKNIIDGNNTDEEEYSHQFILHKNNNIYDFSMREFKFEKNDVYIIDIAMSSGSGKLNIDTSNICIYKRNPKKFNDLKLKASKEALSHVNNYFPNKIKLNPKMKMGLKECFNKNIITAYPCTFEKENEYIARIKFTVIVRNDPILITGRPADDILNKLE